MYLSKLYLFAFLLVICTRCVPLGTGSVSQNNATAAKRLLLEDRSYESQIKTIRIFPFGTPLFPAVVPLDQQNLYLEFDDLRGERNSYFMRIVHCNFDWTLSQLQHLDYLPQYNEFPINNSEFSIDTKVQYARYWATLPPVKLPGNYVVVVYRGTDRDDIVLSARFMVYDRRVTLLSQGKLIGPGSIADVNQQINFTVNYKDIPVQNPMTDMHVSIRQNERWDNFQQDIQPAFIKEIENELDYRFFDEEKMFRGGNEFRFFDIRSLRFPGRNVARKAEASGADEVFLVTDKSRRGDPYAIYDDINGNFIIENKDLGDVSYADYAYVNFYLSHPRIQGEIYLAGAFTYWSKDPAYKMEFDTLRKMYTNRLLMKQGWYDYQYMVYSASLPPYAMEGSYYQTENIYEIFVYFRSFQPRADLLVGYVLLAKNPG